MEAVGLLTALHTARARAGRCMVGARRKEPLHLTRALRFRADQRKCSPIECFLQGNSNYSLYKQLTANFSSGMAKHWVGLNPNILNQLTAIVVLQESTEMPLNII